jgi:hypothetical protein
VHLNGRISLDSSESESEEMQLFFDKLDLKVGTHSSSEEKSSEVEDEDSVSSEVEEQAIVIE